MIILFLVFIVVIVAYFTWGDVPISNSFTTEYVLDEIEIQSLNKSVYLKQATWGVSSDSRIIVLSSNPEKSFDWDSENDFLYKSGASLFYKVGGDTLYVLSTEIAENPSFFGIDLVVFQERIENSVFNQLIKDYRKEGYSKFPE